MLPSHCNVNYLTCGLKADIPRRVENLIAKQKVSHKEMKLWSEIATHFLGNGNTNLKDPDMKVTMVELHDMYLTEEKSVKRDDAHK